ncbi:MAG: methionyl-tRNA formyltransferase [Christensenellales bacterium]|jgi:methionyl-tRNA formyltransferase
MNIVFMGTPEFGVPILKALLNSRHKVQAVVCQPDRPGNRGVIAKPPVKCCAEQACVDVLQFNKISKDGIDELIRLNPDIMVTAAFGQILSDEVLNIPKHGVINVHASLLPKYRGSAPVNYAIIMGETETGVTIMQTVKEVDSGDIILQKKLTIGEDETAGELTERLSYLGRDALIEALDLIESGSAKRTPQEHSKATWYPMLKKEDGKIDFNKTPENLINFIRGMTPWPSAYTFINGRSVKILKASKARFYGAPGEILFADRKNGLIIGVSGGAVKIEILQMQGKKPVAAEEFLLGNSLKINSILC